MNDRQYIMAGSSQVTAAGSSWLNIVLGIWVIISPFVLQFARFPAAMWNNVIVGVVIAVLAIIRTSIASQQGWSWANVILGIWMIISAFALGVMTTAMLWNNIILGIVIGLIAIWERQFQSARYCIESAEKCAWCSSVTSKTLLSNFRALGLASFDKRAAASFFVVSNRLDFLG